MGSHTFFYTTRNDKKVPVHYHLPKFFCVKTSKIIFCLHGKLRNGVGARNNWIEYSNKSNTLVLCPEFSEEEYPTSK